MEVMEELERVSDLIAADLGPAPGAERVSEADTLAMWGQSDPRVAADPHGFKQLLMSGTIAEQFPDLLNEHSEQALGIVRANPEIAQMLAHPMDEELAEMVTRWAEYPLRGRILAPYEDDPEGQVAEADRLDALWQKRQATAAEYPDDEEMYAMMGGA